MSRKKKRNHPYNAKQPCPQRSQVYLDRLDSYQNRTYKAHGRALLRLAEILKESRENDGDDRGATD